MITPWGPTEKLRTRRLRHGRGAPPRSASVRHQRERLFAAMVGAVAERGYEATSVEDLVRISGVARSDFYGLFDCKQDCFLAAVDEVYAEGMRRVRAAYRRGGEWEQKLRRGFRALLELLVSQPAAAKMCVVDIYAAGEAGVERAKRGAAGFERLLRQSIGRCEHRRGLPPEIVSALVGAIQMVLHDRLRRGAQDELPALMDDLLAWMLSYTAPPVALPWPGAGAPPSVPPLPASPVGRLLAATAEAVAEKGYAAVTVDELASRGSTSLRTIYANFGGKRETFLACFDAVRERALAAARAGYGRAPDWPRAVHGANRELLAYLASEPALARVAVIEVLGAGREALEHRDLAIRPFADMLGPGHELAPEVPAIAREAMAFGVYSLIGRQIERRGAAALPRIGPTATYFDLAPFLGAARAAEVAAGPVG